MIRPTENVAEMVDECVALFDAGFDVMPVKGADSNYKTDPKDSKRPAEGRWMPFKSTDEIRAYYVVHPSRNYAIMAGDTAAKGGRGLRRLVIADVDSPFHNSPEGLAPDGLENLAEWEAHNGSLPRTWTATTPSQGQHLFYEVDEGEAFQDREGGARGMVDAIDIRGAGYVIGPCSFDPVTGNCYEWDLSPEDAPLAKVDESVRKLARWGLCEDTPSGSDRFSVPSNVGKGSRHAALLGMASSMRAKGFSLEAAISAALAENRRFDMPEDEAEVRRQVEDVFTRYPSGNSPAMEAKLGSAHAARGDRYLDPTKAIAQPVERLTDIMSKNPKRKPFLIDGLLRMEGKAELAGPSKGGKSTECYVICTAIANGTEWMGRKCRKCPVLIVNTENDEADLACTFKDIVETADEELSLRDIHVLNLTGITAPLDTIAESIIAKANAIGGVGLVLIDPIYKVITGDENSATDMGYFMNVLDTVRREASTAVLFVHHHSKGAQNYSSAMNRGSGSSVFSRDPTCIIDMSPISVRKDVVEKRLGLEECREIARFLSERGLALDLDDVERERVEADAGEYRTECRKQLSTADMNQLIDRLEDVRDRVMSATAYRFDATVRGARKPMPWETWFEYPRHVIDRDGILSSSSNATGTRKDRAAERVAQDRQLKVDLIGAAVKRCEADGVPATRANVLDRMGKFRGEAVKASQLKDWTVSKAVWSPWRVDPVTNILFEDGAAEDSAEETE